VNIERLLVSCLRLRGSIKCIVIVKRIQVVMLNFVIVWPTSVSSEDQFTETLNYNILCMM
jgi:hypothetical protein